MTATLFALAVFVSAFLLFQIQPLISKAILPWFGGTPAVWTTCMLFFQVALFGGYAYAHLVTVRLPPRIQGLLHLVMLAVALAFLNILPSGEWKPTGAEPPVQRIVLLLFSTVGLPYFILSTTGPLLQRWFSLTLPGASPYRLYALSNAGSLLALLSYPFLFEPALRMSTQAGAWSIGFWVFAGLCALCAVRLWLRSAGSVASASATRPASDAPPTFGTFALWFVLAMVASTMLLAVTNEVCQDVAVIPFLWVVPLSLYLLSFILCFESDRWYKPRGYALGTVALILAVCWLQVKGYRMFLPLQVAVYFATLFAVCMLCHGQLARMRPDPRHLTAFYLTLSAGGAGGGLFVALAAPLIFPAFWELYVGLIACCFIAIIVYFGSKGWLAPDDRPPMFWSGLAILLVAAVGTVFADAIMFYDRAVAMRRNFYGVLQVEVDERDDAIVLRHGRVMHGLQLRAPDQRGTPTMYYGVNTGVGRALAELRGQRPTLRVGLVGLGVGTLAAYGQAGDEFRFYEINDNVERLAQEYFTFLKDSPAEVEIVMGDARLSLEHEPPQEFDLLVLDAFSGDAIPTHLLTRESMDVCLRHVRPDGMIAIHISNLHFDLRPVTDALAESCGLSAITLNAPGTKDPVTGQQSPVDPSSIWVLLSRDAAALDSTRFAEIAAAKQGRRVLWTDDFSNLFEVLKW